jgi:polysaccharide export outer membrane protein
MRINRFLAVVAVGLAVAGCMRQGPQYQAVAETVPPPSFYQPPARTALQVRAEVQTAEPQDYVAVGGPYAAAPVIAYDAPYTLDTGDRLRISVFGQEGLTNSYSVDVSGSITMPLIGAVRARGLTPARLSQSISERLRQGFIREPHVTLEVEAYRPFFVLGEVTTPGQYAYVPNMTAETAVAIAGGFGPRAERSKISVTRNIGGQSVQSSVPLNYPLRPGDTLRIDERWF